MIRIENLGPNVVSGKVTAKSKKNVTVSDVSYKFTPDVADVIKMGKAYKLYLTKANEVFFAKHFNKISKLS